MPEISVITSFYDSVEYLPLTVKSILESTFTDFELLLVDDGAPHDYGRICDVLADTDRRIRVFHKKNGGPASAANVGLDNARGRYVAFVDGDDLIEPDMLETLYRHIQESGCPMAACGGDCIDEKGERIPGFNEVICSLSGKVDALELFRDAFSTGSFYGPLSWNKLIERRLFEEKKVRYDENMLYGDDASVLHRLFDGETIFCSNRFLYHYRSRRNSLTNTVFHPRKLDDLTMYYDWVLFFREKEKYQDIYQLGLARYWQVFYQFYCLAAQSGQQDSLEEGFAFHKMHLDTLRPELLACRYVPRFEKLRLRLFCISPRLAYSLARLWGRLHGEG